jgi:muramoyltetrapeptide carboxypeptidase LdcA involved in peptidoglycan recycling
MVNENLPSPEALQGAVLCFETSELIPDMYFISDFVYALGRRGYLDSASCLLMARPKAYYCFGKQTTPEQAQEYRVLQRETITAMIRRFNPKLPAVFGLDFGHTDPQIPLPFGGLARLDFQKREMVMQF